MATTQTRDATAAVQEPPRARERLQWRGPSLRWVASTAGVGEFLFTLRIGSLCSNALFRALIAAVALKWFSNREVGRCTVCTGAAVLAGRFFAGFAVFYVAGPVC